MANMEKLNSTMRYIRTHRDLWAQDSWYNLQGAIDQARSEGGFTFEQIRDMILEDPTQPGCGVTGCMAGLACFQNGWVPQIKLVGEGDLAYLADGGEFVVKRDPATGRLGPVDYDKTAKRVAAEIFDISWETAGRLFDSENSFEDLQAMVAYIGENGDLDGFRDSYDEEEYDCGDPECTACYPEQNEDDDTDDFVESF